MADVQRPADRRRRRVDGVDLGRGPWCGRSGRCPARPIPRPTWSSRPSRVGFSGAPQAPAGCGGSWPVIVGSADLDSHRVLEPAAAGRGDEAGARRVAGRSPGSGSGVEPRAGLPASTCWTLLGRPADHLPGRSIVAGHQRQDVDGPDGRRRCCAAFGLRTGRYTSPHLESVTERIVHRRRAVSRGALRRRPTPRSRHTSAWSTTRSARSPAVVLRDADRHGVRRVRRRAGRRRGGRGRASAGAGTPPTSSTPPVAVVTPDRAGPPGLPRRHASS